MNRIKTLFASNASFFKELIRSGRFYLFLQLVCIFLAAPSGLITAYAPKRFIDSLLEKWNLFPALFWICVLAIFHMVEQTIRAIMELSKKRAVTKAKIASKEEMYKKLACIDLLFFESPSNVDMFNKVMSYTENGGETLLNLLVTSFSSLLSLTAMSFLLTNYDWWILCSIIGVVLTQFIMDRYLRRISFLHAQNRRSRDRKQNYYNALPTKKEILSEIKINNSMPFFFGKYKSSAIENINKSTNEIRKEKTYSFLFSIPGELFNIGCYIIIGIRLIKGDCSIGDYTLFFVMINTIRSNINTIIGMLNLFYEQSLSSAVVYSFYNSNELFQNLNTSTKTVSSIDSITFEDVSFSYPGQDAFAVNHVSLKIGRGERISVVGCNGAGKTTFIKLLSGLYPPSKGTILINGVNILDIELSSFWKQIGCVFQSHQDYALSVLENVAFSDSGDENVAYDVLKKVGLLNKVAGLKNKIHHSVSHTFEKDGVVFSGGEKQKLAVARALYKNGGVLILDEPSSSLDPQAEDMLYKCLSSIPDDITVIIITHRLSSVSLTERILFFKDGKIIADGSHNDLFKTCEDYHDMFETQSSKFIF